ncbi:MAG: insulinase family protein [Oscillospiraceae bacterium]|nr:insulinase family protein [Oscillospiraceae bacterium]
MIEKIYNDIAKETCLKYVHKSGVAVFMLPMEGYSSACAQFSVKFGSEDNSFSINGGEFQYIPDGTAHYLEHKLFESEEKNAFELFAQTGAACNACTSFDYTQYYFSGADNFGKNLEILLGFVQDPYFTPENVEKERGIIGQEITMYRDSPGWRVFTNLMENMFALNPVRLDIAGTVESIAQITDKTLYDCYNTFYNPANMYLCVAGKFDPDEVVRVCEERLRDREPLGVKTAPFAEPNEVINKRIVQTMPVAKPLFEIGFKRGLPSSGAQLGDYSEDYLYYNILFDVIFGGVSDFFERMRENGSINEQFGQGVMYGRGFMFPFARGESDDPDYVLEQIQEEIRKFKKTPPPKEQFSCIKKASYGTLIRGLNDVDTVASMLSESALAGVSPLYKIDLVAGAEYEKMLEKLESLDEENVCISIVKGENK